MWILAFAIGESVGTATPNIFRDYFKDLPEARREFVFINCDRNSH
jgi:hypothetical protein